VLPAVLGTLAVLAGLGGAAFVWRGAIWRSMLDPKTPYPVYRAPPAPDYAKPAAWALWPSDAAKPVAGAPPVDVFFVGPTLGVGGREWNTPIGDPRAEALLQRVVLPNYAGPFKRVGRVFAPRYRAATLFTYLTLRDDARDARVFAYGDVRGAFEAMLRTVPADRPLVIAGVGQGAELALRLLQDKVEGAPDLRRRIAAVYLMNAVTPVQALPATGPLSPCRTRAQAACVVAWARVPADRPVVGRRRLERALTWTAAGGLDNLSGPVLCVNPLTGGTDQPAAPSKANLGAADATGLEWGARPAFLPHEVSAACEGGLLVTSRPATASVQRQGWGLSPRPVAPFNLFYADIEADAQARVQAFLGHRVYGAAAPPITAGAVVGSNPIHRID
jgi:hypothetical protein